MHQLIGAEPFSEDIIAKAKEMRAQLDIPAVLDTPFFIPRFLKANDGDVELAKERITEYLIHRKCLGYGEKSQMQIFTEHPIGKETFERFNISLIEENRASNNVHVFLQRMEGTDLNQIMKTIPLSHVVHSYFLLQEVFGQIVAKTERATGNPSSVVCVLDLSGINMTDFLNPLSAPVKLARIVVKIWADYFSENMCKILIINPPSIVAMMWKVTKLIIDPRTISRLHFLQNLDELKLYLEPQVIPVAYGGEWIDHSGYADPPEFCCRQPLPVVPSDHKSAEHVWSVNGYLKPPTAKSLSVKGHQSQEIVKKCESDGLLIWSFTTSSEVEFEIVKRESGKEKHVWPKHSITSLKLPEYGSVQVSAGEFIVRFTNPASTWLPVKIQCSTDVKQSC